MPFKDPLKKAEYEKLRQEKRKVERQKDSRIAQKIRENDRESRRKTGTLPRKEYLALCKTRRDLKKELRKQKGTKEYEHYISVRREHWAKNRERINEYQKRRFYKNNPDRSIISAIKRVKSGDMSINELDKFIGEILTRTNTEIK
jgi:hypothetical protein